MILSFDHFSLNTGSYKLWSNGDVCEVEPMAFDLIVHFASHPEQIFTQDELIEAVWKGRIVSDATVATCVKNARKVLGDTGTTQIYIQTVRGRGYRFSAAVSRSDDDDQPHAPTPTGIDRRLEDVNSEPAIMILPFRCLSEDLEVRRIAESLPVDLDTVLSRIPLLHFSTEAGYYEGRNPPPTARQVHEEFGVDFVLAGSLQDIGGSIRANIQLSDAKTGYRLWAETFPLAKPLANALEHGIRAIVGKLEPQLHRAIYNAVRSGSGEPNARQLFLEASGLLVMNGWNHESFVEASAILYRSLQLEPDFSLSLALLSLLHGFGARIGLPADLETAKTEALRTAEQALRLDGMNSFVLGLTGCSLADIGDPGRGEALLRNAIDLNPANAQAWVALGTVRMAQNDMQDAVEKLSKGIEMSPLDSRLSVWGALLASALLKTGDIGQACAAAETACQRHDRTYHPRVALAGARLAQAEDDLARRAISDARRIKSDLSRQQIEALVDVDLCNRLLELEKTA